MPRGASHTKGPWLEERGAHHTSPPNNELQRSLQQLNMQGGVSRLRSSADRSIDPSRWDRPASEASQTLDIYLSVRLQTHQQQKFCCPKRGRQKAEDGKEREATRWKKARGPGQQQKKCGPADVSAEFMLLVFGPPRTDSRLDRPTGSNRIDRSAFNFNAATQAPRKPCALVEKGGAYVRTRAPTCTRGPCTVQKGMPESEMEDAHMHITQKTSSSSSSSSPCRV